ncbi:hypothetical protein ACHAWF_014859 [Thalassiosira exigua]
MLPSWTSLQKQKATSRRKRQRQPRALSPGNPSPQPLAASESERTAENKESRSAEAEETEDPGDRCLALPSTEISTKKFPNQNPYSVADVRFDVLRQRLLDNLEDMTQKNNGKFKGESKYRGSEGGTEDRRRLGEQSVNWSNASHLTRWAAHAFVKLASTYDLRIVVVSPVNHFVFTPMLASAAVETVEYIPPIRATNPYIDNFVEGGAIGVDVANRKLQVQLTSLSTVTGAFKGVASSAPCRLEPEPVLTRVVYSDEADAVARDDAQGAGDVVELTYDHLCAVGTASRSAMVPGAREHCFNLKTSQDATRLRTAIGEALEMAIRPDVRGYYYPDERQRERAREERKRRVRIAAVGGGPTGVELCGELSDLFGQVCRFPDGAYQYLQDDVEVMLIHGAARAGAVGARGPGRQGAFKHAAEGGGPGLHPRGPEGGSDVERTIPLGIAVWAAGNAPVPFVRELLSQLPPSAVRSAGRVNVDRWLRCPTRTPDAFGSVLVLGDAACLESRSNYDDAPRPLPQTAQDLGGTASSYGTPPRLPEPSSSDDDAAFSLLRAWLVSRGLEEAPGFDFLFLGLLAYIGREEALNQVMVGDVPLFNLGGDHSGKVAFALWRSVYLAKQASSRNQALIAFDWLRTEAFGRDITRL